MSNSQTIGAMFGAGAADTFLGLEACPDLEHLESPTALLGVPCATPYPSVGAYCAGGPRAIRAAIAGYAANLQHMDFDSGGRLFPDGVDQAVDCGDLELGEADPAANRDAIRTAVSTILDRGAVPVLVGGDDSIPIPMLDAFAGRGRFTILQIDAHIDWREDVNGERFGLSSTMRRASEMDHIERIIQVGQRGLGSARVSDYDDARDWGVTFVSARQVAAEGIGAALHQIEPGSDVIICFDCDALDPAIMPGVIGRAPGGLSYWQAVDLIEGAAARARIAAFDLVEFMPDRDVDDIGALTAARILATTLGVLARQKAG